MAIFHATTKPISRSSGRSATASAAYRAGCEIIDNRTGLKYDYSKKSGVLIAVAFDKNDMQIDRSELWNLAEKAESRKDGRTAREWILALPYELIPDDEFFLNDINKNRAAWVAFKFAQELAKRYSVAVDVAIHEPAKDGDNRNYHAHIMTTTRELKNENGQMSLGEKSTIELSNEKRKEKKLDSTISEIKELRGLWANIVNNALDLYGCHERIDHRSHKDREIELQPTRKIGWRASAMQRRGIETERFAFNEKIIDDNKKISELQGSITVERYYQAWLQRNPNLKQVSLVKELAIRTPFDLLNININLRIESPEFESKRTDLEGDMYISKTFYDALELTKDGYKLICKFVNNEHLEESRTAQNIKNFMSENMQSTQVLLDYGELSIDKFTDKYAIDCDLSDLITLHEKNPVAELKSSQKSHDVHFERLKDNDQNNDFTI